MKCILLAIPFALFAVCCKAQDPLQGLWQIDVIESQDSSGQWVESAWMKNGMAYLHYDGHSIMSLHFVPEWYTIAALLNDYTDSSGSNGSSGREWPYWYLATYEILPEKKIVRHHRIMHSDPNEWGKVVQRYYDFRGDTLILRPEEYNLRLKWVRREEEKKISESILDP